MSALQFPEFIYKLRGIISPDKMTYLVGGSIRDVLLARASKDIDIVTAGDPAHLARTLANELKGAFYSLDKEREIYRVLLYEDTPERIVVDFARLQGGNIEKDLGERDFTINAMATDLQKLDHIIDPAKGGRDLQQRVLRPVRATSISDDPVRAIRAVRYAAQLGLKIDSETLNLITIGAERLCTISEERVRDELFKILEGGHIQTALQLLNIMGLSSKLHVTLPVNLTEVVRRAGMLETLLALIMGIKVADNQPGFYASSLLLRLRKFGDRLVTLYAYHDQTGRNRQGLLQLAGLVQPPDFQLESTFFTGLALSGEEWKSINIVRDYWDDANRLMKQGDALQSREIYRFFQATGAGGLDLVLLILADYAIRVGSNFSQDCWLNMLGNGEQFIQAWFEQPDIVSPKPLLSGHDLMFYFDMIPGPLIGELLEQMKEEQAAGELKTVEQTKNWVEQRIMKLL